MEFCKQPTALWTITGGQLLKIVPASRAEPLRDQSIQVLMRAQEVKSSPKPTGQHDEAQHNAEDRRQTVFVSAADRRKTARTNDKKENPGEQEGEARTNNEEASSTLHFLEVTHW